MFNFANGSQSVEAKFDPFWENVSLSEQHDDRSGGISLRDPARVDPLFFFSAVPAGMSRASGGGRRGKRGRR